MATHSSTLAWKIPWTEEPGGLQSMGSWRVGHHWSNLAAAAACYIPVTYVILYIKCPVVIRSPSCVRPFDTMDYSMPGLPLPHHLPKFAQVPARCISNAIQPPHPLIPSSLSALSLFQHQGLFQWVGCSHQITKNTSTIPQLKKNHNIRVIHFIRL